MHRTALRFLLSLWIVVLLLLPGGAGRAQYFKHYNARALLGATTVYKIAQDRQGFLWFCTNHGLVKWDGHRTQHFTRDGGLPDDIIFNIYEDRYGRIWPFAYNGEYSYIENGRIHNADNNRWLAAIPPSGSYPTAMAQAGDSVLYIGFATHALLRLARSGPRWLARPSEPAGGMTMQPDRLAFTPYPQPEIVRFSAGGRIRLEADRNGIRIHAGGALIWSLCDARFSENQVSDLGMTSDGRLLACTRRGIWIFNLRDGSRRQYLTSTKVSSCCLDVDGNIWISTLDQGVYVLHRELEGIEALEGPDDTELHRINGDRLLFQRGGSLLELAETDGRLVERKLMEGLKGDYRPLLITAHAAAFFNQAARQLEAFGQRNKRQHVRPGYFKKMFDCGDGHFLAYGAGELAAGRLDARGLDIRQMFRIGARIAPAVQDAASRDVYFRAGTKLYRYSAQGGGISVLCSDSRLAGVTAMVVHRGALLLAAGRQEYYSLPIGRPGASLQASTAPDRVLDFVPLPDSGMLLACGQEYYLHGRDGQYRALRYPFPAGAIESMETLGSKCLVRVQGRWYAFPVALLNARRPASRLYLEGLSVNKQPFSGAPAELRNTMEADVQIRLGRLDFSGGASLIRYRVRGKTQSGWNTTAADELSILLNEPGRHIIEVAAAGGDTTAAPLRIGIVLHRPFTRTPLFYGMLRLAGAVAAALALLVLMQRRKRHHARELAYLKLEHRAINALLNPHFIFNAISNIQSLILRARKDEATDYLTTLSRLIRQNLENLQQALIPLEDELSLIERYLSLQNLRFGNCISLEIDNRAPGLLAAGVPPLLVHTFVENAIVHGYRSGQQGFRISISISRAEAGLLHIVVRDNGKGLQPDQQAPARRGKTSMGISFNRSRLERLSAFYGLRQSISLRNLAAEGLQGTEVSILLSDRLYDLVGT